MRVLLISPLPHLDPACGDVTYTQTLLANPPVGVEYVTYADALASGDLVEHARRDRFRYEPLLTSAAKAINVLRSRRVLFWEPFRFFSVKSGRFDLVHMHVFAARFLGLELPLLVSGGSPQADVYLDARKYSRSRVRSLEFAEKLVAKVLGVNAYSFWLPQAARLLVYSEYFRDWCVRRRVMAADKIDIVPIFLGSTQFSSPTRIPKRVGYIAKDFDAKGGATLLRAFERVRAERRDAELWIVGSPPRMCQEAAQAAGITWIPYISRDELLGRIMPSFDVFAYPTNYDCISYVLLEAMSQGIPIATSDYPSMPEAVDYGRGRPHIAGWGCGVPVRNILRLLEPQENSHFRRAAWQQFSERYSSDAVLPKLRHAYDMAIQQN